MAYCRGEMDARGVTRAAELRQQGSGRTVRMAGCVIVRQRPATASGFVFVSLEDETGIANVIVTPDVFERVRPVLAGEPFLLIEGTLQHQDGVVSVRAERMAPLMVLDLAEVSRDFH